mmetsp:Transcript_33375/g.76186  ORF Transcript_33375/g.76186 Transcript_33375/m.76186 type:complete len:388 (+) Transcript_33375:67-1230(+)
MTLLAEELPPPIEPNRRCPICLEDADDAVLATEYLEREDLRAATSIRCPWCLVPLHRACLAKYAVTCAEEGRVPVRCPTPSCSNTWPRSCLALILDAEGLQRLDAAVELREELQAKAAESASSGSVLPEAYMTLGIRRCPGCQALIQKQGDGLITGCDKMTCRCGCMFCFKCGMPAGAQGVARCRCVGKQHSFIAHSAVLNNYAFFGNGSTAHDEDLTKRRRGKPSRDAVGRLKKEHKVFLADPPPFISVSVDQSNLLCWNYLIQGPPNTPYAGGWYWGLLEVPKDYPFSPPLVKMCTPNGRFHHGEWLCTRISDYHPEGWTVSSTISGLLLTVLTLMCDTSFTPGALHPPPTHQEKRDLAAASLEWNKSQSSFLEAFPDVDQMMTR